MNGSNISIEEAFEAWLKDHKYTRAEFDAGCANIWKQDWTTGKRLEEFAKLAFLAGQKTAPHYFTVEVTTVEDPPTSLAHVRMGHEQKLRVDVRGLQWINIEGRK